jgi:hypothetical protein
MARDGALIPLGSAHGDQPPMRSRVRFRQKPLSIRRHGIVSELVSHVPMVFLTMALSHR